MPVLFCCGRLSRLTHTHLKFFLCLSTWVPLCRHYGEWGGGIIPHLEGVEPNLEVVLPLQARGWGTLNNYFLLAKFS